MLLQEHWLVEGEVGNNQINDSPSGLLQEPVLCVTVMS